MKIINKLTKQCTGRLKAITSEDELSLLARGIMDRMLTEESDRSSVIVGVCVLDELLEILTRECFSKSKHALDNAIDPLFLGMGPLSSFSARIKLAYALQLIDRVTFTDLETLRSLRNLFSHTYSNISFTTPSVTRIISDLQYGTKLSKALASRRELLLNRLQKIEEVKSRLLPEIQNKIQALRREYQHMSNERIKFVLCFCFLCTKLTKKGLVGTRPRK